MTSSPSLSSKPSSSLASAPCSGSKLCTTRWFRPSRWCSRWHARSKQKTTLPRRTRIARRLATAAGLDPETVAATYFAARVHDIGKIGVPDEILNKKEALSPEEVAVMRTVPVLGAEICRPLRSSHGITEIIRHQKERVDGTGYPDGLSGEEISHAARILAICDAYDSLVSGERAERPQMADERARAVLLRQSGRAYDEKLVWLLFNKVLPPVSSPVS